MTAEEIEALLRLAEKRGLSCFEYECDGVLLRFGFEDPPSGHPSSEAGAPEQAADQPGDARPAARLPARDSPDTSKGAILSPGVGFFRRTHPAGGAPPPDEGATVAAGTVVAFIQAGPIVQPVVAMGAGRLGKPLVEEGSGVGFGSPLFGMA